MHNKVLGIVLCFVLLAISIIARIYSNDNQYYHQYLNENYIMNSTEDTNYDNWNIKITNEDDYLLNEYFFMNLAGDIIKNSPLVRYSIIDDQLVLLYQKPEKAIEPYAIYEIIFEPKNAKEYQHEIDSNDSIMSFVDYNYLTTNARYCQVPYSDGYSISQIKDELSNFEKCIYSSDYDSSKYGYKSLVDVYNFVNYFLIYELAYSGYYSEENFNLYKDENNRYSLCHNSFNGSGILKNDDYHNLLASTWFSMITKSDEFAEKLIDEYKYLRMTSFSEKSLEKELEKSVSFMLSCDKIDEEQLMIQKNDLYNYLIHRINWLDNNIESIKQFSALSAIKEYKINPY